MADKHSALDKSLDKGNIVASSEAIARSLREFEEFSRSDRERYLLGGLTQTGGDQAVCEWIAERYDHLARMARAVVPYEPGLNPAPAEAQARTWALAMLLAGHASKWRKIAGLRADSGIRGRP